MAAPLRWFTPPAHHKVRPTILNKLRRRLRDYERRPTMLLPSLAYAPIHGEKRKRYQYIQRRRACIVLLEALVHYVDVVTLRVGLQGDQVLGVALETLAEQTGLNPRTQDRALADITAAGLVVSYKRAELVGERYVGHCAVRRISDQLFIALGLGDALHKARQWHYQRRRAVPLDPAAYARLQLRIASAHAQRVQAREGDSKPPMTAAEFSASLRLADKNKPPT